jgi:hypothetical protein
MAVPVGKKSMTPRSTTPYPLAWRHWPRLHTFFLFFYLAAEIICCQHFLPLFLLGAIFNFLKSPSICSFCIQLLANLFYKYLISAFWTPLRGFKKIRCSCLRKTYKNCAPLSKVFLKSYLWHDHYLALVQHLILWVFACVDFFFTMFDELTLCYSILVWLSWLFLTHWLMCSYDRQVEICPNLSKPYLIILWLVRICLETIFYHFPPNKILFPKSLASLFSIFKWSTNNIKTVNHLIHLSTLSFFKEHSIFIFFVFILLFP